MNPSTKNDLGRTAASMFALAGAGLMLLGVACSSSENGNAKEGGEGAEDAGVGEGGGGKGGQGDVCAGDEDCDVDKGLFCISGSCEKPECETDADCCKDHNPDAGECQKICSPETYSCIDLGQAGEGEEGAGDGGTEPDGGEAAFGGELGDPCEINQQCKDTVCKEGICSEPIDPCDATNETTVCPFMWKCVMGTCDKPECLADSECAGNPNGEICDTFSDYVCVECVADAHCAEKPDATVCDELNKKCVGCQADSDCGTGFNCDVATATCKVAPTCNPQCPSGQDCVDDGTGTFVCQAKAECAADEDCKLFRPGSPLVRCDNGKCKECDTDPECAALDPTYSCQSNLCEPTSMPGCTSDQECQQINGPEFTCDLTSGFCLPPQTGTPCLTSGQPDNTICEVAVGPGSTCDPAKGICTGGATGGAQPCEECATDADCAQVVPGVTCAANPLTQTTQCKVPCVDTTECTAAGLSFCSPFSGTCACGSFP